MDVQNYSNAVTASLKGIHPLLYASVVGVAIAFWGKIKSALYKLDNLFFDSVTFAGHEASFLEDFISFIYDRHSLKKSILSDLVLETNHLYYSPNKKNAQILMVKNTTGGERSSVYFWKKIIPIFITQSGGKDSSPVCFTVKSLKFTPLLNWIKEYQEFVLSKESNHFYIREISGSRGSFKYKNGEHPTKDSEPTLKSKEVYYVNKKTGEIVWNAMPYCVDKKLLIMPNDTTKKSYYVCKELNDFMEDFKFFINSKQWYEDRGLNYKRGYLLYGEPGTGKTFFVRLLAEEFNLPIYKFDLVTMNNSDFKKRWREISSGMGLKIILIEDFSSIFHRRDNITNTEGDVGVSFDCFLNVVDGVDKESGVILIISTNHIDLLDEALYNPGEGDIPSRPGRIDMAVKFNHLDEDGKRFMANRILNGYEESIEKLITSSVKCTPAQFEEMCKKEARLIAKMEALKNLNKVA